jgi:glutathione S-transferase
VARRIKLYTFTGSGPSLTARLMLEHKGLEYSEVHMLVGPHAFSLLARGFDTMCVPALKIDGRRVQGSRVIARALDDLVPEPALFPADPELRREVVAAERWGEGLQDLARRLVLCAAQRDGAAFHSVYRHPSALRRPAQHLSRPLVTRLASAAHRATDAAAEEDVAGLDEQLGQVDAWIAEGVLDGPELNAADFQIAPSIALLLAFADLRPVVGGRAAASLAQRVVPGGFGAIGAVLPAAWLPGDTAVVAGSGRG